MNVVALAGGVGGAKLADGLTRVLSPEELTIVVNTGDDFEHLGLHISPDLDTVCYTLAGINNPETGWGRENETWRAMQSLNVLGGPKWFNLGDRDLGTHLERTRRRRTGQSLSRITSDFCRSWGIRHTILPMSDDPVPTWVDTGRGELQFQEYFVRFQCEPQVRGFSFRGIEKASPAPGVIEAISQAEAVIICPSNPWVSIDPILSVPGIRDAMRGRCVVAVSPIIAGETIKGPAAKMYREMGIEPSALAVARHYGPLLSGFIFDNQDRQLVEAIEGIGIRTLVTDTIMKSGSDRVRLAEETLKFIETIKQEQR